MVFKKFPSFLVRLFLLCLFFKVNSCFAFAYPYERMEIVTDITKKPDSLIISQYTLLKNKDDRIFKPHYWKIYYQNKEIVGEELFVKGCLSYYYVYFYDKTKIYQKGFFWYGIYRDLKTFKAHDKILKQGWIYKNIPDSYKVFDRKTKKLTYQYIYPNKEI